LTRVIERKADHTDLKQVIDDSVSKTESSRLYVEKTQFDSLRHQCEEAIH